MSIEYEIDTILKALDNIDDAYHIDWDGYENGDERGEPKDRDMALEIRR
jgi:hypothetical protein